MVTDSYNDVNYSNSKNQATLNNEQLRLLSLIEFAQQSAKLKLNPTKEVIKHNIFHLFEHDLIGLPGIHFNCGGEEEIWLSIERLWESQPPTPTDNLLSTWIELSNNPEREPFLKDAVEIEKLKENQLANEVINKTILTFLSEFDQRDYIKHQFKNYFETQWKPWATEERKRRNTIKLYAELFTLKQQLEGSITDTQIEFVWGIGIGLWKTTEFNINYPLITQLVDISLNQKDMSIEIRPNQTESYFELDLYISLDNAGVADLEKAYKDFTSKQTQVISPFDPVSYQTILQLAVTHLDPGGVYWSNQAKSEDKCLPKSDEKLKITDSWVLFARPRSKSIFIQDLENFKKHFENNNEPILSNVLKAIFSEPSNVHRSKILPNFRGISSINNGSDNSNVSDLFFPMPFNDEQVNIIQMLECSNGVVVQGPPGTGKTHTIANIISHYMANGKRVLITSMKEPALSVLKDKLPEAIRPLAITLLANGQQEMKQFESAVSKIAQELQIINRKDLAMEIEQTEHHINELHAKLVWIDRSIETWAKNNIEQIQLDDQFIYPINAAKEIIEARGCYEWLDDSISINNNNTPKFDNTDITCLRDARRIVSNDLDYLNAILPELNELPQFSEVLFIHNQLSKNNKLKIDIEKNSTPSLGNLSESTINLVGSLIKTLSDLENINNKIKSSNKPWVHVVKQHLNNPESLQLIQLFEKLISYIDSTITEKNKLLANPVFFPDDFELTEGIIKAIINKTQGKPAFAFYGLLGKGDLKKKLYEIRILNKKPKTIDEWTHVYQYALLQLKIKDLILRWNSVAPELSISIFTGKSQDETFKLIKEEIEIYRLTKRCYDLEIYLIKNSKNLLNDWPHHHEIIQNSEKRQEFFNILNVHFNYYQTSNAWQLKDKLQSLLRTCNGKVSDSFNHYFNHFIGNISITESELQSEWLLLIEELKRIHKLKGYLCDIKDICARISESGGINWSKRLLTEKFHGASDHLLPNNWQQAWRLKRLANYINSINQYDEFKKLTTQRIVVERELAKAYQDAILKRTWLKLADNATPDIKAALQAFRSAIAKIGKGTGKRAIRYRRDAKNAASRVNKAIPCWIMPHYRVSESLPAEFGCFDLVIIDEASQSDLSALPAILRAKKLLIVGDDKQVSPEGVGLEEEKINNLMIRFLSNQVEIYRQEMSPERSIYDLCKVVFSDSQIMLREHFRCIAPIIEYSKREFYDHELKPIRLPKASERLNPPLIDVIIEDGFRNNKINIAEAKFIVEEIKKICSDPRMQNFTIGVVSLLGNEQSQKIWGMLEQEISLELITRHDITCGDARIFQGKERNIMFLSMIITKEHNKADTKEAVAQRFNVAASRARDRMYLVRSIELEHLSHADVLRRRLIEHFDTPFLQDEKKVKDLRELCESEFELELYDFLTEKGYRVIPQVKAGTYRIDMVVEGNNDARLAIECDGDRYHGADVWENDMNRQRILERAGWQFWRCFASNFVMDRKKVIEDLINTLTKLNIEPIGSEGIIRSIHSEQRRIRMFNNENI